MKLYIFSFLILMLNAPFIVNSFNFFGFIPKFQGIVTNSKKINFETPCFDVDVKYQTNNLTINLSNRKKFLCSDNYVISNNHRLIWKSYILEGENTLQLDNITKSEIRDIDYYGLNIFYLEEGIIEATANLVYTTQLFIGENMLEYNLKFLKEKMNIDYNPWNKLNILDENEIKSGDLLAITRLDGLDPTIMYGTGSHIGHTAIALWINDELYICESTDKNPLGEGYWPPPYGIIKTPYRQWMNQAQKAEFLVNIIRLSPKYQKKMDDNIDKVVNLFKNLEGLPYGYRNFLFGWIDTQNNNFPSGLSKEFLINLLAALERNNTTKPIIARFIDEALSKRIGKNNLSLIEIINNTIYRKQSIYDLMALPEHDDWEYSDGYSYVCNTFVLRLFKEAGIFEEINNLVNITEFTPKDTYELQIFDSSWAPEICKNSGNICQIMGNYELLLPNFNTIPMYNYMNQYCPSVPPNYFRPNCC